MKALVYTAEKEIQFRDEPAPEPGPGEVVVAIDAVGICGSDMHADLGHDHAAPGHDDHQFFVREQRLISFVKVWQIIQPRNYPGLFCILNTDFCFFYVSMVIPS